MRLRLAHVFFKQKTLLHLMEKGLVKLSFWSRQRAASLKPAQVDAYSIGSVIRPRIRDRTRVALLVNIQCQGGSVGAVWPFRQA